jgi:hypothetical protein
MLYYKMAKRTLRKPKTSLAKKIQRKTRSKRLRSRGRRMSDKALTRSRSKQKKSKRRGKILRGGVPDSRRKNPNPMRAERGDERTQSALRRKGLRDAKIAKASASQGRVKVERAMRDPRFESMRAQTTPAMWNKAIEGAQGHQRIKRTVKERQGKMPPPSEWFWKVPVEPLEMRPDAPGTAEIVAEFQRADKDENRIPKTYLENAMGDVFRGVGAPLMRMGADFVENPRRTLNRVGNYARFGASTILGDNIVPTALAAASAAGENAIIAGQAAQAATSAAAAAINSGRDYLANSLRITADSMDSNEPTTFVGEEIKDFRNQRF